MANDPRMEFYAYQTVGVALYNDIAMLVPVLGSELLVEGGTYYAMGPAGEQLRLVVDTCDADSATLRTGGVVALASRNKGDWVILSYGDSKGIEQLNF